jgi:hypothetical protein
MAARRSERRDGFVFQFGLPHLAAQRTLVLRFRILRSMAKAGSNPAFDVTYRGSGLARAVASRVTVLPPGRACVDVIDNRFRLFPSVPFDCAAMRLGEAVVKMSVTSVRAPSASAVRRSRGSNPAGRNAVAQSLFFGAATAATVPRQPLHDP